MREKDKQTQYREGGRRGQRQTDRQTEVLEEDEARACERSLWLSAKLACARGRRRSRWRSLFRIVYARGAIPEETGPTRCRNRSRRILFGILNARGDSCWCSRGVGQKE